MTTMVLPTIPKVWGGCVGVVSNVTFTERLGGWHGGGMSINGRGMEIDIIDSTFTGCKGGNTHLVDGKGGAVTVCGGVQDQDPPQNNVYIKNTLIENCTASGNGGGLYVTISGLLQLNHTIVQNCKANDDGTDLNEQNMDFRASEGMGGGVHVSAGGKLNIQDNDFGATSVTDNIAINNGGGISTKSGRIYLYNNVNISSNEVDTLSTTDGYGNGGGLFVGTSYYDDGFVWIEDWELKKGAAPFNKEYIEHIENLGHIPSRAEFNSGGYNHIYAQATTWWGKPLDPQEFWKDKVIWYDKLAERAAHKKGRGFPPLPSHVMDLSDLPGTSTDCYTYDVRLIKPYECNYVQTEQERTFWYFRRHLLLRPPEEIDRRQFEMAERMLNKKNRLKHAHEQTRGPKRSIRYYSPEEINEVLEEDRKYYKKEAVDFAFPEEPFQDQDTLLYCYIDRMRKAYQALKNEGSYDDSIIHYSNMGGRGLERFWRDIDRYEIDRKMITYELDPAFVARGTAWQTNYLTRLRNEGWDESYIEAYKKAWDVKNFE